MDKTTKIFKELHGNIEGNFVPLNKFNGHFELMLGLKDCKKEVEILKEKVPHLFNHLYFMPNQIYTHFCYYMGNVFIEVQSLEWDIWETFEIQKRIEYWVDEMEKLEKQNDYVGLFGVMEKKILIRKYIQQFKKIPFKQKYDCFRDLWRRSEYGFELFTPLLLKEIFAYKEHSQERKEDMKLFKDIVNGKDTITIYRGVTQLSTPYEQAISWTLNKKVAEYFATRFKSVGRIYKAEIKVEDVFDYLDSRDEEETLINPSKIFNVECIVQFAD